MSFHIPNTSQRRIITIAPLLRIASNGFCRVTKYRRCRVCGKPDWCGFTADEQTSICMRVSNGSKGTSRNGGNIFHHNRLFLATSRGITRKQAPPPIEIAPIEVRNAVYQELIRRSPVVKYYSKLIDGPNGLLSRGLRESDAQNYGALPRTHKERAGLVHTLNKFLKVRFPEYVGRSTHAAIIGVPGFSQDELGNLQLWSRDYKMPLLVIPSVTLKAASKPANSGFTGTIFALAKRNTDGLPARFPSEARVRARQSTSRSGPLICRR